MERADIVGVDLSKDVFQICTMSRTGNVVRQRRTPRDKVVEIMNQLPAGCRVYMEACQGSHYWSRKFRSLGLESYQIAPQFVRPYVKSQKNDRRDAEAICEAGSRANMRFVPMKSEEQLELQAMHRIRERLMHNRTALTNQIRGILAEHGVVVRKGTSALRKYLQQDLSEELSPTVKSLVQELKVELATLESQLAQSDKRMLVLAKQSPVVRRLCTIPGIGRLTALALVVISGDPREFKNGRQFAAFIGVVPRQVSTGGRSTLLGITKRGNIYVRTLLVHGARSVIRHASKKDDPYSLWVRKLHAKYGTNHTAVALANKNARIAWRILTSTDEFDSAKLAKAENIQ